MGIDQQHQSSPSRAIYQTIDLNTVQVNDVYTPPNDAEVSGVFLDNTGSSALPELWVSDGTDRARLTPQQTGGDSILFGDNFSIDQDQTVQIEVTDAEGSSLTGTAVIFVGG